MRAVLMTSIVPALGLHTNGVDPRTRRLGPEAARGRRHHGLDRGDVADVFRAAGDQPIPVAQAAGPHVRGE